MEPLWGSEGQAESEIPSALVSGGYWQSAAQRLMTCTHKFHDRESAKAIWAARVVCGCCSAIVTSEFATI
jgi:hypothetical protein